MGEREYTTNAQILKAIEELRADVRRNHHLMVGNGNKNAIIPRLDALERHVKDVPMWQSVGDKFLTPIITAIVTAGLVYLIFGA